MENIQQEPPDISTPATYRIGVFGALGDEWIEVLNGMGVDHTLADGQVLIFTLQGELADQAALLGILNFL